jgi:hypothetical protein
MFSKLQPLFEFRNFAVEATPPELPRDLQNPVVVSPVVRLFSLPTPAVNSADVDDETMAAIGQGVVAEAPCVALEVVAPEQVFALYELEGPRP